MSFTVDVGNKMMYYLNRKIIGLHKTKIYEKLLQKPNNWWILKLQ